jgi:hypothetical protein
MKHIQFEAVFGNERKKVEISQPHQTAEPGLHLSIDNYYCGRLAKYKDEWKAYLNSKSIPDFTSDDIQILGQIIEKSKVFDL